MNRIAQTVLTSLVFFTGLPTYAENPDPVIVLSLDTPQKSAPTSEDESAEPLTLHVGNPLKVSIINKHDRDIYMPASPSACAIVSVRRRSDDTWEDWSDCSGLHHVDRPVSLAPDQIFEGKRSFRGAPRPIARAEVREGPLAPGSGMPSNDTSTQSTGVVRKEKEVQQTIMTTRPVPFFERFSTLPAGEYQLATSYVISNQPGEITYARSEQFTVAD